MYRPLQYVDNQSLPGCQVSNRRTSRSAKNDMRPGIVRKDKHGLRGGQHDDAPRHRFGTGYGGCRFTPANTRATATRHTFSRPSSPIRKIPRFHELACAKKPGCGPNCKYSRCAAKDPCYATPFYTPNERQDRRGRRRSGPLPSPSLLRNTCSRMARIIEISQRVGDSITMGLKYLHEVQDPRSLDVLPLFERSCDGNCADCSDDLENTLLISRESIRGGAGEVIPDVGLKTKTVAINTERSWYEAPEFHEPPTRTLKDMNSNSTLHKQTSPIPVEMKTPTPTPLPRVALLRPPRPAPPQNITIKDRQMIRYALQQQERVVTPHPKYGHVATPSPRQGGDSPAPVPLHGHEVPASPGPRATPPPAPVALYAHEAPRRMTPEAPPFHSLISRREGSTPPGKLHPLRERWLPGKISPRMRTPPVVSMTNPSKTPSLTPKSQPQSTQHLTLNPAPNPTSTSPLQGASPAPPSQQASPPPVSTKVRALFMESLSKSSIARHVWLSFQTLNTGFAYLDQQSSQPVSYQPISSQAMSSQPISLLTSNYDSDITTTTTDSNCSSEAPTMCVCSMCGKSENVLAMTTGVYKNNNNPLYNLASPMQSPGRDPPTMGSSPSRARMFALEVLVLLVLGGLVTLGLMSFVENVFGAYLARNYMCLHGKGPHLVADGLKSGVMNWVTCPMASMDESQV